MAQHMSEAEAKAKAALQDKIDHPSTEVVASTPTAREVALRTETMRQFADMARVLPTAEGDASMSIVAQILAATTVEELDAPWNDTDGDELVGVTFEAQSVTAHQSDYADGLGVFLRVEGVRLDNGEVVSFSTGSVSTVAQLVKAYVSGWFPFVVEIVKAERPTKKGYFPLHLKVVAGKVAASSGA